MDDWRLALENLRRAARRMLLVEVPHPEEVLEVARHRGALAEIHREVASQAYFGALCRAPALRQPALERDTWMVPPLLRGTPFHGSGSHSRSQALYGTLFAHTLGYLPYPGSLNVRVDRPVDLGPEQLRIRPDRVRDYRLWRARLPAFPDVTVHLMDVGERGWGPDSIELLSPIRLRDLGIGTSPIAIEVLW
jgi:hypothetical protein